MVHITMKSTIDRDEWLASATVGVSVDELTSQLTRINNLRVRLGSQRMAMYSLMTEEQHMKEKTDEDKKRVKDLFDEATAVMAVDNVTKRVVFTEEEVESLVQKLEAAAREIFPDQCGDVEGKPSAVDRLWKARDDPDIDEDERLRAWYFLQLIDPEFKARELLDQKTSTLWWAGKELSREKALSDYIGRNEKTKLVCKLTGSGKGCPNREPRMAYDEQRKVREHIIAKREEFKTLEPSELAGHKNVTRRPADFIRFSTPTSDGSNLFGGQRPDAQLGEGVRNLNTDVKKIYKGMGTASMTDVQE
eukprot:Sspe_Gene.31968::Locus_15702_Transcript_2_2_Confidence_0.500_Length_1153::g.31968::m.31968